MNKNVLILILILIITSSIVCADLTTDQAGYYSLDNSDTSGAICIDKIKYNGTITQTTTGVAAVINEGYFFDGTDDYVTNNSISGMALNKGDGVTICTWINASAANEGNFVRVIKTQTAVNEDGFGLQFRTNYANAMSVWYKDTAECFAHNVTAYADTAAFQDTWYYICGRFAPNGVTLWVDGELRANNTVTSGACAETTTPTQTKLNIGAGDGGAEDFTGMLDEIGIWNRSLTQTEISELYNGGNGSAYPFPPPAPTFSFSFTNEDPINGSTVFSEVLPYQLNFTFNYTSNESITACSLDINGLDTVNETFNVINDTQQINYTFTTEVNFQEYTFSLNCTDPSFTETQYKQLFILMDETEPAIMIYSPAVNNSTVITQGIGEVLDLNVTVFDDNLFNSTVNIYYPNGSIFFTNNSFNTSQTTVNFTNNFSMDTEPTSTYTVQIIASDGHTKKDIDFSEWDIQKSQTNKLIDYGNCAVYPDETSKIDTFDYDCQDDRCTWTYTYKNVESVRNFYYECDEEMIYLPDSDYLGHFVSGDNWIDAETVENLDVTITRLTDHKYKVSYNGVDITEITTKSIGELNTAEQNVTFEVVSLFLTNEAYDNDTVEFIPHNLTMQITNKSTNFGVLNNVTINYDSVVYPTTFIGNDTYLYTGNDEVVGAIENRTVEHYWITMVTPSTSSVTYEFNTTAMNQTSWNYLINDTQQVTSFQTTQLLNVSVFDEITGQPINITVDVNLVFDNSYHNLTQAKTFDQNQTFSYYVAPNSSIKNMTIAMYGSIILSGTFNNITYITRSIDINQGDPIILYNNGTVFPLSLYAIGVENSTTVTYSWKTTDYADIAGTMRVYRCNPNGSVFIVESLPITGGIATANIELLTAQYKYDVIIGSTVYQQDSFFTCHIESLTARSFFVDISNVSLAPVIGLYMIDCTLDLLANTTIDMRWTENSQDSSPITGCIAAYQSTVFGNTEFYRNCTNTSLQLIRSIPDPGGSFYVNGLVYQNSVQGYCQNTIPFDRTTNAATQFGATMVFSIMFLILGISLVYAGKTTESLLGAGVAIVLSYFLGIIALPWTWVAAALSLLIAIALLIRYGRGGQ